MENEIRNALSSMRSSLLTIAAIFIGIYVTVFTLLGSIKVDSIFAFLNEKTFKKLVVFIRNAFIASFAYIILVIALEIMFEKNEFIPLIFIILNILIVIYMLLTAIRFGIILYNAFSQDIDNIQQSIVDQQNEHKRRNELYFRIEKFLDEYEAKQNKEKSEEISEIIEHRKKDK
ncbi:hypothetical protein ACLIA0_12370 [Bacillaceae bacterium W0354]